MNGPNYNLVPYILLDKAFCKIIHKTACDSDMQQTVQCLLLSPNGTAHLCLILTLAYRGQLRKGHQKIYFVTKIMSVNRFFYCLNFSDVFKNTFFAP